MPIITTLHCIVLTEYIIVTSFKKNAGQNVIGLNGGWSKDQGTDNLLILALIPKAIILK
jgi:hypothetical protein